MSRKSASRGVRLPFRVPPGCTARRLSPLSLRLAPGWVGSASPGVLRPYDALTRGAPSATLGASRSWEARLPHLAGSALGLNDPSAASATTSPDPGCPVPVPEIASPRAPRPCFMPLAPLGFALQSLLLSRSRTAFRRPCAPLRVRRSTDHRRGDSTFPVAFRRAPPRAPPRALPHGLRRQEASRRDERERDVTFPRPSDRLSTARVAPCGDLDDPP